MTRVGSLTRIVSVHIHTSVLWLAQHIYYQLKQQLYMKKVYIQPIQMMHNMSHVNLCMRRIFTKHTQLQKQSAPARNNYYGIIGHSFPGMDICLELSGESTRTTTNKYINEDSLTKHYAVQHIATQNHFNQNTNFLSNGRQSEKVLDLSETKTSCCTVRAWD